jgi:transposase
VGPLLGAASRRDPKREYKRKPGAGRKRTVELRVVFAAIVRVLRTGCQWNTLSKERDGVCSSSAHAYFMGWASAGVFVAIWKAGLAEYDELAGIAWEWQSVDGSMVKAPLGQEAVGPNPTDRGKKRKQNPCASGRAWMPSFAIHNRRQRERHQRVGAIASLTRGLSAG